MTSHSNINRPQMAFGTTYSSTESRSNDSNSSVVVMSDQEMANAYTPFHSTRRPVTRSLARRQQSIPATVSVDQSTAFRPLPSSPAHLFSSTASQSVHSLAPMEAEDSVETAPCALKPISFNPARYPSIEIVHSNPVRTEQSSQKIFTNETPCNLVTILGNSQLTGRLPRRFSELPDKTLSLVCDRIKTQDYPMLIKKLDQSSVILNLRTGTKDAYDLFQIIKEIENRLTHYTPDEQTDQPIREEFEIETINLDSAKVFRQYGGIEIFKRILLTSLLFDDESSTLFEQGCPGEPKGSTSLAKCWILKIKCKCIYLLNRLICLPNFGKTLVHDLLHMKPQTSPSSNEMNQNNAAAAAAADYDTTLLQYLFSLLLYKESRLQACELIESILLHMPMLNLNRISNIHYILHSIDDDGLSCLCKVFAVTLSDLDLSDKKYWANAQKKQQLLHAQQQQQASQSGAQPATTSSPQGQQAATTASQPKYVPIMPSIRDQNQELLLSIPTLLNRLVNLVRKKDYSVRFPDSSTEIENWIRYIDQALSDTEESDNEMPFNTSTMRGFNPAVSSQNNAPPPPPASSSAAAAAGINWTNYQINDDNQLNQPALVAAAKLNNFVHVLYTLSLLLIGKERKRVQKSLAKLRLASALNSLFDYLIWNCRCEYPGADSNNQQQMRSHICPEVAVKIQFLRLVHSFCDHSEFKRVVLSKEEIEELLVYNREVQACLQVPEDQLKVDHRLRCTKEKAGLLSKIVQVIKREPFSASFRFWLTRAIESFLRGGTSYADQMFLVKRGIVEDTIRNILAVNFTRPKEVLQSCFDMLGELVKFNRIGFEILNTELNDPEKFNTLLRMINQSLVDSNMFLRSIFLSIDFFEYHSEVLDMSMTANKLLAYFESFDRRILFICRMINTITIHNLSQENVSCLNTTLVVLMMANKRSLLPKYLKAIREKSIEMALANAAASLDRGAASSSSQQAGSSSASSPGPLDLMNNFRDLLMFWQGHYLQKDKDCIGLEQNSRIEFVYWKHTVELLLDANPVNPCALSHYLHPNGRQAP